MSYISDIIGTEPDDHFKERFWSKVDKRGPDECWEWLACINHKGYGQFQVKKSVPRIAHRIAFALEVDVNITQQDLICHKSCNNRKCCNPKHLYKGTPLSNMQDMIRQGRAVHPPLRGTMNGNSKMDESMVRRIRSLYQTVPTQEICQRLGIRRHQVYHVISGRTWKHIS